MSRCVWSRNLKNEEAMARVGPQNHRKKRDIWRGLQVTNCKVTITSLLNIMLLFLTAKLSPPIVSENTKNIVRSFTEFLKQAAFSYADSPASLTCPKYSLISYTKTTLQHNHNSLQPMSKLCGEDGQTDTTRNRYIWISRDSLYSDSPSNVITTGIKGFFLRG
jgi:hypothetical protein